MRQRTITALLGLAVGVSACAYYDEYGLGRGYGDARDYGGYAYDGQEYRRWDEDRMRLSGPGADALDPWLALTSEGRDILARGFNVDPDGGVDGETARRANVWFRRYADHDRDMRLTDAEIRTALVHASRS